MEYEVTFSQITRGIPQSCTTKAGLSWFASGKVIIVLSYHWDYRVLATEGYAGSYRALMHTPPGLQKGQMVYGFSGLGCRVEVGGWRTCGNEADV